jgi:pimeloyl-ACP methyl ester carboxylesterase
MSARYLAAGGHRLEYAWWGPPPAQAPTLVFLHEGLGSVAQWRDFPGQLAKATGFGAFAYSRLGYGHSDPVELPRPLRYMHNEAGLLPEVLGAVGIKEFVLVGHSDGASIAIIHAGSGRHSGLKGLILEAPHVFAEQVGLESIEKARQAFLTTDLPQKLAKYHGENLQGAFWGWNRAWLDPGFHSWNLESYLPQIQVPTLVIQGEDDQFGTTKQVEAVRSQVCGPVEVLLVPQCGHSPHRDHPKEVLEAMSRFVKRTPIESLISR